MNTPPYPSIPHRPFWAVLKVFSASLLVLLLAHCSASVPTISGTEYVTTWEVDSSYVLLDVRTEKEWNDSTGHLQGAVLLPIQELEEDQEKADQFEGKTVVVYCRSGGRASRATRMLRDQGIRAYNLEGGIREWIAAGRPVVVEPQPADDGQEE